MTESDLREFGLRRLARLGRAVCDELAQGRPEVAAEHAAAAESMAARCFGYRHPRRVAPALRRAEVLQQCGQTAAARRAYLRALSICQRASGTRGSAELAQALNGLGSLRLWSGDARGAVPLLSRAVLVARRVLGLRDRRLVVLYQNLTDALLAVGRLGSAERSCRLALDLSPRDDTGRSIALLQLADIRRARALRALERRER